MHNPERKQNSVEHARRQAEADVETAADVEGAAAAQYESERRDTAQSAAEARAAQETKASAEGKQGYKDNPSNPPNRPGNFTGENTDLTTESPPPDSWQGEDVSSGQVEEMTDTQERSDTMAGQVAAENRYREEQEREREVDENINTDPATLEESGEVSSPPGPSVSHDNT